jgi:hypothetical protein
MHAVLIVTSLLLAADKGPAHRGFEPNPLAPSLPELTREEEDQLDEIINRFIKYDIGQLRNEEGKKALREFEKLGPEAIPAMIRGLNRAAKMNHSCPTSIIAKKLTRMLAASADKELLLFAQENVGAGVEKSLHAGILRELRLTCSTRRALVMRATPAGPPPLKYMATSKLSEIASNAQGTKLKDALIELEKRRGNDVIAGLATAALSSESDVAELGRNLLEKYLSRQDADLVRLKLKDTSPEVRKAAARAVAAKLPALTGSLIDLLGDEQADVREVAHQALVKMAREDFGPAADATRPQIEDAIRKWQTWWQARKK